MPRRAYARAFQPGWGLRDPRRRRAPAAALLSMAVYGPAAYHRRACRNAPPVAGQAAAC